MLNLRGELYRIIASSLGSGWRSCLQQLEYAGSETIEQRSLESLLSHAVNHVPYYRTLGIRDHRLESFPLLSREALRTNYEALMSDDLVNRRWSKSSTGGSTGEPVWTIHDQGALDWDYATDMYYMSEFYKTSYPEYLRSRRVAIWHRRRLRVDLGLFKRLGFHLLGQVVYIEPYVILSERKLTEYVRRINRHKPALILAFAGTVFEIAKHARRMGLPVHKPRFILTSVETLYPAMRATIQDVFGCRVYNRYGAAEVGRIAAECSDGKLHVLSFNNHVEVLDSDGLPTQPGDQGRVVVTSLHNLAMPLIRYDIGDLVRLSAKPCTCGRRLPAWDEVSGRVMHHFVRTDGSLVFGGNFIAMFYEYDWILQLHVLQEDLDRIVISFRRTPGARVPDDDLDALGQVVRKVMGHQCQVEWQEVDVIPHSAIGKHLHARSLVWEQMAGAQ